MKRGKIVSFISIEDEDLAKMDDMQAMGAMNPAMQMGMMPGQGGPDPAKLLNNEKGNQEILFRKCIHNNIRKH